MGWVVSRKLNFIFIHIPKTAGSSIGDPSYKKFRKGSLIQYLEDGDEAHQGHIKAIDLKKKVKEPWQDFFKFCFVRNPWDRLVSAYSFYKQSVSSVSSLISFTQEYYKRHTVLGQQISKCQDFREFCLNMQNYELDLHFEPQLNFITDTENNVLVDFIGRFENLKGDLEKICDRIKIPQIELPHYRKTKRKDFKIYYDDETKEIVSKKYQNDIEFLNYSF